MAAKGENPGPANFRVRVNERALEIVQRLATDDAFRDEFESEPAAALAEYGIAVDPEKVPESVELPPKEELADLVEVAGEPDDDGYLELPTDDFIVLGRILGAMAFVEGEQGDHAR